MSLHHLRIVSYNTLCLSKMYLIFLLLLGNGLHLHSWIKSTEALPVTDNKCKNNLVVINSGMYDLSTDLYDLKSVWESCNSNISGTFARDTNPLWKVCRSASYNLQMLCNVSIKQEDVSNIWKPEYEETNVCQGISNKTLRILISIL